MKAFEILKGHKFEALALYRAGRKWDLPDTIGLGGDLFALASAPLKLPDHWEKWLGSIRSEQITGANLWCVCNLPSANLEILDDENSRLSSRVQHYFLSLLLVGPLTYETGYFMTGSNAEGMPGVRQFGDLGHYFPSHGHHEFVVSPEDLVLATQILESLLPIFGAGDFLRVRRGIRVFWRGLQEPDLEDRLHQFVRSLDAIVMSGNADEFGERARLFATAANIEAVLKDSYTLRSMSEHLQGWERVIERVFPQPSDEKSTALQSLAEEQALRMVRQLEEIARDVYRQIILIPDRQAFFRDGAIRQFWKLPPEDRHSAWPNPLNIELVK